MRICLHLGPPCTGTKNLLDHLIINEGLLSEIGVALRVSQDHRNWLQEAIGLNADMPLDREPDEDILAPLNLPEETGTLILCDPYFMGPLGRPYANLYWYGRVKPKIEAYYRAFSMHQTVCSIALSDPARLIPALYGENLRTGNHLDFKTFLGKTTPEKLLWSELIERLQLRDQYRSIITWNADEYAFIWRQVVAAMTHLENPQFLEGRVPLKQEEPNVSQLEHFLKEIKPLKAKGDQIGQSHWDLFLGHLGQLNKLPGHPRWSKQITTELSDIFDEDLYTIARMEQVTLVERPDLFGYAKI